MTASRTCAVQMLLVAFSRRMCCSRVWRAMRNAGWPCRSTEIPMMRPGVERRNASRVAKNAACGPPPPIGTPNRWLLPTTMSAPSSPGERSITRASGSAATATSARCVRARATIPARSGTPPPDPGYWTNMPKHGPSNSAAGRTSTSRSSGPARVRTTSMVWGWQSASTKNRSDSALPTRRAIAIASAAAVASSSSEALASSMPVRSMIICW